LRPYLRGAPIVHVLVSCATSLRPSSSSSDRYRLTSWWLPSPRVHIQGRALALIFHYESYSRLPCLGLRQALLGSVMGATCYCAGSIRPALNFPQMATGKALIRALKDHILNVMRAESECAPRGPGLGNVELEKLCDLELHLDAQDHYLMYSSNKYGARISRGVRSIACAARNMPAQIP
jgi:hypothetical protein